MTLLYIVTSLVGIWYLAVTNPKRRRTFDQPVLNHRKWVWPSRLAVFTPGVLLIFASNWAGLSIWAGAVTVFGWGVAATSPVHLHWIKTVSKRGIAETRIWMSNAWSSSGVQIWVARKLTNEDAKNNRIEELETRIAELEAELSDKKGSKTSRKQRLPSLKIVSEKTRKQNHV